MTSVFLMLIQQNPKVGASGAVSWADYASVIIAGLALVTASALGLSTRRTAERALELSERQEARRESRLDLYLHHSRSWRRPSFEDRLLGFNVQIANPSDRANAVVRAELHVTYSVKGVIATVKVPRLSDSRSADARLDLELIQLPARLGENDAVSGWLLFRVKDALTEQQRVDRYEVVIRDLHNIEEGVQVTVFDEVLE
jgi:hypothetical protein